MNAQLFLYSAVYTPNSTKPRILRVATMFVDHTDLTTIIELRAAATDMINEWKALNPNIEIVRMKLQMYCYL